MDSIERDIKLKMLEKLAKRRASKKPEEIYDEDRTFTEDISDFLDKNILESLELKDFDRKSDNNYKNIIDKRIKKRK